MIKYILCFLVILQFSCLKKQNEEKVLLLQPNYDQIQDVFSIADCDSPFGKYITELNSFNDGSCYFFQKFDASELPFIVKIDSLNNGFLINESGDIIDSISHKDIVMIRGHEIHKMSIDPRFFFDSLTYKKPINYLDSNHHVFSGFDKLNNPVELFYNNKAKLISKIKLLNPKDTSQTIEIVFDKWITSKYGDLPKEVKIIQAKKDSFFFNFRSLRIRDNKGYTTIIN